MEIVSFGLLSYHHQKLDLILLKFMINRSNLIICNTYDYDEQLHEERLHGAVLLQYIDPRQTILSAPYPQLTTLPITHEIFFLLWNLIVFELNIFFIFNNI